MTTPTPGRYRGAAPGEVAEIFLSSVRSIVRTEVTNPDHAFHNEGVLERIEQDAGRWLTDRWSSNYTDTGSIILAGILSAHLVAAKVNAQAGDDMVVVGPEVLKMLWSPGPHHHTLGRLSAARQLQQTITFWGADVGDSHRLELIGVMLRRSDPTQVAAAANRLTISVTDTFHEHRPYAALAWCVALGERLLAASGSQLHSLEVLRRRTAVVLAASGQHSKVKIAELAGVSRPTLDKWIQEQAGQ